MELQVISKGLPLKATNKNYVYDIRAFNRYAAGRPVDADLITEYFEHIKGRLKPDTIGHHKSAILGAIKASRGAGISIAEQVALDLFFKGLKTGKRDVSVTDDKTLSKKELQKLVKIAGPKTRLLIRALYETAARASELVNIELANCKEYKGNMIITINRKRGKVDNVLMTADLFNEIRAAYQGGRYLFECNGKPMSRFTLYAMIKRAGARIGRGNIHPHTLRHSWATIQLPILGLSKVSKYLSHSSTDTTAKYYLHGKATPDEISAANALTWAL